MRNFRLLAASAILTLGLVSPVRAELFKEAFPDIVTQLSDEYQTDVGQLDLRHGNIVLEGGFAQVAVPEGYYFLGPKDGRYVIEKLWENPEDRTLLGVIFPAELTPFDSASWAITFQFEEIGYVSDADAESYDYAELLKTMQSDTVEGNETRAQGGFPAIELLGWAAEPHYDKVERKLHWAKRLSFAGTEGETLNYNIRALGRKGVLIVNFIAAMDQLGEVQLAVPEVLEMVSFTEGNRYADYVPGVDTMAAVGIGGLIAGKVAAKAGLLIVLLAFLKKGFILLLLPLFWLKNKFFGKRTGS